MSPCMVMHTCSLDSKVGLRHMKAAHIRSLVSNTLKGSSWERCKTCPSRQIPSILDSRPVCRHNFRCFIQLTHFIWYGVIKTYITPMLYPFRWMKSAIRFDRRSTSSSSLLGFELMFKVPFIWLLLRSLSKEPFRVIKH